MTTDDTYRAAAAYIDAHSDDLIELLAQLVACRTDSQSEGNAEFAHEAARCHELLRAEIAPYTTDAEAWVEDDRYPVTVARVPGGGGRTLALNGHLDVVPVGDSDAWFSDPWTLTERDGKLYGRGTCDMKAGVCAAIFALRALNACGATPAGDAWLHIVSDEEVVGNSTKRVIERMPRPDAVIDMEPSGLAVIPSEGGLIHLRIEVEGVETHAGNRYTLLYPGTEATGVNAIEKLIKIVVALQDLERSWAKKPQHSLLAPGFNTLMPAVIVGGPGGGSGGRLNLYSNPGTVSNYASVEYNIWYLPNETYDEVHDEIERFVHHACQLDPWLAEHPPTLTWKLNGIFYPPVDVPRDSRVIASVCAGLRANGHEPVIAGLNAASELAWYTERDIPGVLFGPGSLAQAHSPQEFVPTAQLTDAAKTLAYVLLAE